MNSNNSNRGQQRKVEEMIEGPQSDNGDEGEAVNGGRQAGPNSDRGGQPLAPQVGDPRAKDRRPN
jgi:hypothetical protein